MPPTITTTTLDKGTNTDEWDEYSEIKKLTELNNKLMITLEKERQSYRFFLTGISKNLTFQQESLAKSLKIFEENVVGQEKMVKNADVCKSISLRQCTPEASHRNQSDNLPGEILPVDFFCDLINFRVDHRDAAQERQIAEIRPFRCGGRTGNDVDGDYNFS